MKRISKKIKETQQPIWQNDGIDNRIAFAALVGSVLPDFTEFIMREKNGFLESKDVDNLFRKRFNINMAQAAVDTENLPDSEEKNLEKCSIFLYEVFSLWRKLWNSDVEKRTAQDKDSKIAIWNLAFQLCDDNPIMNGNKQKYGEEEFAKDRKVFGLSQRLAGGLLSLSTEFMNSLSSWIAFQEYDTVTNQAFLEYANGIHLGLLETMREFTPFTLVAGKISRKYVEQTGMENREMTRTGKITYTRKFFQVLEDTFMKYDAALRTNEKAPKKQGTMQCPAKMSVVGKENVVTILCREVIIPVLVKYYLPWRKENIPGA